MPAPEYLHSGAFIFAVSALIFILSMVPLIIVLRHTPLCGKGFIVWYTMCAMVSMTERILYSYNRSTLIAKFNALHSSATREIAILKEQHFSEEHTNSNFILGIRTVFLVGIFATLPSTDVCTHDASGAVLWPMMSVVVNATLYCVWAGGLLLLWLYYTCCCCGSTTRAATCGSHFSAQ
jgi:hypothetical protein